MFYSVTLSIPFIARILFGPSGTSGGDGQVGLSFLLPTDPFWARLGGPCPPWKMIGRDVNMFFCFCNFLQRF